VNVVDDARVIPLPRVDPVSIRTSRSVIAIVDASSSGECAPVRWHDARAELPNHRLPDVCEFSYFKVLKNGDMAEPAGVARPIRREVARGVRRVRSLATALDTDDLAIGEGVVCQVMEPPTNSVVAFVQMSIGARAYHVMMMGVNSLSAPLADSGAVNFVIGSCLFSDRAVRLASASGNSLSCVRPSAPAIDEPVRKLESSSALTLYELETASRLPWLTADMIALLPAEMPVTVTSDVPRVQYYLYLLHAFRDGFVSMALMHRWFALVDERSRRVSALLERELAAALANRLPGRPVRVRRSEGMAVVEPALRRSLRHRSPLPVSEMAGMLSARDEVWKLATAMTRPASYGELINLSYVVEQLRSGIARPGEISRVGIAIDNPGERRICSRARTLARAAGSELNISVLGLYPLERAFTSDATGPTDLFYNDPGHAFVDQDERRYGTAELLATLYPNRAVQVHAGLRSHDAEENVERLAATQRRWSI
jgi:hypothetical protein